MTDAVGLLLAILVVLCCAAIWSLKALVLALWLVAIGLAWLAVRKWWQS